PRAGSDPSARVPSELHTDLSPRLRAPARVQHHAQNAVDAEPGVPEAGVGVVHLPFGSATRLNARCGRRSARGRAKTGRPGPRPSPGQGSAPRAAPAPRP